MCVCADPLFGWWLISYPTDLLLCYCPTDLLSYWSPVPNISCPTHLLSYSSPALLISCVLFLSSATQLLISLVPGDIHTQQQSHRLSNVTPPNKTWQGGTIPDRETTTIFCFYHTFLAFHRLTIDFLASRGPTHQPILICCQATEPASAAAMATEPLAALPRAPSRPHQRSCRRSPALIAGYLDVHLT